MMSDHLLAALLGIIEGITEFLPVSSTAHLRIAESLLGLSLEDGYWKMFSVAIQLGAVLCLPVYFYARILSFLKSFFAKPALNHPLVLVVAAFVATAIPSYLLMKVIGENLENLRVMAMALIAGGIIMAAVDWRMTKPATADMADINLKQAVVIGLCQVAAAVFPGLSRSMATIAGGQLMGLSRAAALEFSFFLSMPTMAAATAVAMLKSFTGDAAFNVSTMTAEQWTVLGIGFFVSFVVAYGSVAFLMHWVRRHGFLPFAIYRVLAGLAIIFFML